MATYLEQLKARHELYLAREKKILESYQSYTTPEGMAHANAALDSIRLEIRNLNSQIAALDPTSAGVSYNAQILIFGGR